MASATNTTFECPLSSNDSDCNTSTMSSSARKMETGRTASEAFLLEDKDELQNHLGSHYILQGVYQKSKPFSPDFPLIFPDISPFFLIVAWSTNARTYKQTSIEQ